MISSVLMILMSDVSLQLIFFMEKPVTSKISSDLMILISDVSSQLIFFMEKPVTSKDFKWFDDFDF